MNQTKITTLTLASVVISLLSGIIVPPALAQTDPANSAAAALSKLADDLQNPVGNLISVPIQNRWDFGIGPADAMRYTVNIQPVIPFELSDDWSVIARTIVPTIYAESPTAGGANKSGLGDVLQTFFFSPKEKVNGWILGAGPVLSWPTASEGALGSGKFGAGPSVIIFHQANGLTYGLLANHVWSYAGWGDQSVSATLLQPIIAYRTKSFTTFSFKMESTYNWPEQQWTASITPGLSQLIKIGKQPVSIGLGLRHYLAKPAGGPDRGMDFTITFPFPK
ncbi:MAG: hypothetical protein OEZ57_00670 [Nitrospirota bacterium]|nr:hypothetical protein [Nitrospirota bacterium]MDH5773410.1 hypothetical protein [Nitrospirota bacterium]